MKNSDFNAPDFVDKKQIHFCLRYFSFPDHTADSRKIKKSFELVKACNKKSFIELQATHQIIMEKSPKTRKIAVSRVGGEKKFNEKFTGNVWDLKRWNTELRVFGVFNPDKSEFCLLEFDLDHHSR